MGREYGLRAFWQHTFNPLHVYCRLLDLGLPESWARLLCRIYERFLFRERNNDC